MRWPTPAATVWGGTAEAHLARKKKHKCGQTVSELGVFATHVFRLDPETPTLGTPSLPITPSSHRLWQTPQAFRDTGETLSEWRDRNARKKAENENLGSLQLSLATQARGDHKKMRLNPLFVEWLMGWPEQWSTARSDSDSSAMAWCHWLRRSRSALARMHSALR